MTPKKKRTPRNANTSKAKASLAGKVLRSLAHCEADAPIGVYNLPFWDDTNLTVADIRSLAGVALNDAPDKPRKRSSRKAATR